MELPVTKPSISQQPVDQLHSIDNEFPAVLGLIPWGHHIQIFTKTSGIAEAMFTVIL
jgi:hypothetical protein